MAATISLGAPQPWPPPPQPQPQQQFQPLPNNNKNYFFLQPPPLNNYPLINPNDDDSSSSSSDDSSRSISPLMAALIAVLIAAFLCLFYYTVISRYCRRRRATRHTRRRVLRSLDRVDPLVHDPARPDTGLDEAYIRQITVFKYKRGDGLIEATECAVCLADFKEDESLRLMPNCEHAFHLSCIDTWLATHSSCPLCRSGMNPLPARAADTGVGVGVGVNVNNVNNVNVSVAALQVERSGDNVVVFRDVESREQVVVEVVEDETDKETR